LFTAGIPFCTARFAAQQGKIYYRCNRLYRQCAQMLGFVAQYVFQQAVFLQSAVMKNGLLLQAVFNN
jgi:hypothetical protein